MTEHANVSHIATRNDAVVVGARDAAKLLSISLSTLYRQLPEMPARVRLSARRFGWRVSDLNQWIEARREAA